MARRHYFNDDDEQRQEFRRQPPNERYLTGQDLEELRRALSRPRMERTVPPPSLDRHTNLPELPQRRQMTSLELPDSADFSAWCNLVGQALEVAAKKCKSVKDTALANLLKEKFKAAKDEVEQMFSDNKGEVTATSVSKKEIEATVNKGTSKDIRTRPFKLKLVAATA